MSYRRNRRGGGHHLNSALDAARHWLDHIHDTYKVDLLSQVLYPLLIVILGVVLSRFAKRWLRAISVKSRIKRDPLLDSFFLRLASFIIISLSILWALNEMGANVTTFVAGLGVTGLVLAFGLRDLLSNLAAGLLLLIYRPFRAGQVIDVEGSQGVVEELTIVNMQMTTNDGVRVIMPNSKVWGAKITNFSVSKRRRLELTLRVPKEETEISIKVIRSALEKDERILETPAPSIRVTSMVEQTATLTIWAWTDPQDFLATGSDAYLAMTKALGRAGLKTL
jgi:small conductance mechanosensitive channel